MINTVAFKQMAEEVESEYQMSGLSIGLYYNYALEIAKRYDAKYEREECKELKAQLNQSEKTNYKLIEAVDKAAQVLKILSKRIEQLESANFKLLDGLRISTQIDRNIKILRQ